MNSVKQKNFFSSASGTACLMLIAILTAVFALCFGSAELSPTELIGGLLKKDGFETQSTILFSLRLPRVSGAVLSGIGLSVSGVLLQTVTGNALASPNIIGVNAGAGFAVIVLMAFFPAAVLLFPFAAFIGAFTATLFILFISSKISFSKSTVILSGVAVTALLNAGISLVSYFDADLLALYRDFSVGGLSSVVPEGLGIPAVIIFLCLAISLVLSPRLDTLCLGDSLALSLGVNVKALRLICLVLASFLAGSVVSFAGLLGFVGLVVPHISRKLSGTDTFHLIINSSLIGATLVLISDLIGRVVLSPTEIPVGIIMSFIGAPFLFYLIARRKRNA